MSQKLYFPDPINSSPPSAAYMRSSILTLWYHARFRFTIALIKMNWTTPEWPTLTLQLIEQRWLENQMRVKLLKILAHCYMSIFIIFNEVEGWYTGFSSSFCLSVHLWTETCPLCIFYNTRRIRFMFIHLIKQPQKEATSEGVPCVKFISKLKNLKFWQILSISNFDF